MKNFKLTDLHIVFILYTCAIALFVTIGMIHSRKPEKINDKNFSGISAAGFTYNNSEKTGTIINH